ncbi:MAG: 4Fe-4S binding protein [Holophaga sp.]|nr:4Fe-4S binding protein [Holophaga sp.]
MKPSIVMRLREDSQTVRKIVQGAFLLLCAWIGVEFILFMRWGASGGTAGYAAHPAGAEGFLPIAALLSLKQWLVTGRIHGFHPAGLFIFVAVLGLGLFLKKAFCSWMCPVGTLGEALWRLGRRLFGRNLALPRWADYPLRALKYLILGFFLLAVGRMDGPMLEAFLNSPYNAAADVRMYLFFAHLSGLALGVLVVLAGLSLLVQNVWCRYLCPYGALLGLLSLASPLRVTRAKASCIDCGRCTKACPSRIQVHKAGRVGSDECTACYRCVQACPVKDTLQMRAPVGRAVPGWVFGLLAAGLFMAVTGLAMLSGHWRTSLSPRDYLELIPAAEDIGHP